MKTNKETANAFVKGMPANGSNFYTDGETATSYTTKIATYNNGVILVALCYSCRNWCGSFFGQTATTERQKSYIKRAANTFGVDWYEVPNAFASTREEHEINWQYLQGTYRKYESKAQKARKDSTRFSYTTWMLSAKATADNYARLFL